jgi:hypothetical protein
MRDPIRRVRIAPYRKGYGPTFSLSIFDTGRRDWRGASVLAYTFKQGSRVIFDGEDFSPSPLAADDSDDTIAALLGFLTLRPGDTDAEYFERYTPEQREFSAQHAEAVACYSIDRFGEG